MTLHIRRKIITIGLNAKGCYFKVKNVSNRQRTLAIGGSITVRLTSCLTSLVLTNK